LLRHSTDNVTVQIVLLDEWNWNEREKRTCTYDTYTLNIYTIESHLFYYNYIIPL
jgi:hypothetical protein